MRIISLLCVLALAWTMVGCSDDDTLPNQSSSTSTSASSSAASVAPRDLVSYDVNNLIDNGDAILTTVADSYADIGDADLVGIAACAADFAIYPDDLADDATFSTRMARVYHSQNGLFEAWKRDQVIENYDPTTAVIDESAEAPAMNKAGHRGFFKKLWKAAKKIVKKNFGSLIKMIPGVGPFLGSAYDTLKNLKGDASALVSQLGLSADVARQVELIQKAGGFPSTGDGALDYVSQKIDILGLEMRAGFANLDKKISTALDNLVSLRGDVNILLNNSTRTLYGLSQIQSGLENLKTFIQSQINQANLDNAIINHKSFLQGYAQKSDYTSASNYVWENTQVSYQGLVNINTFVNCAMNIQTAAKDSSDLPSGIMADTTLSPSSLYSNDKCGVRITGYEDATWQRDAVYANTGYNGTAYGDILFDYANPKKAVPMSLGNFEYLVQMMEDNLRLNKVIFTGDALKSANAQLATSYIATIQPVKQGMIAVIKKMKATLAAHIAKLQAGTWDDGSSSGWGMGYDGYDVFKLVNGVPAYGASLYLTTGFFNGHWNNQTVIDDYSEKLKTAYNFYYNDYLGLYLAKLMAYEVRLRAYL